ncbi:MAG: hypothetical protein ACI35W_02150 [Anaeroplasmataceae bacterium]
MAIEWFNERNKKLIATITNSNITLNKPASDCISDAYNVMLGISKDEKMVYIKSINKEMAIRGDIPETHKYAISIRQSYARISNKDFIREISSISNYNFESPKKYEIEFNEKEHTLVIDLNREVV